MTVDDVTAWLIPHPPAGFGIAIIGMAATAPRIG
jgi:hypothetical protein